jgi:predicted peptidase
MKLSTVKIPHGKYNIPAVVYQLNNAEAGKKYPLVIFLHGIGQNGSSENDIQKVINCQDHQNLLKHGDLRGFQVLAPLFIPGYNDWRPEWAGGAYVDRVVEWARSNFPNVDTSAIYLTGYSGGGGGTWDYVTLKKEYTDKLAAIVPVAGTEQSGARDWSLVTKSNVHVWAFHAENDNTVNVGATRRQISAMLTERDKLGGDNDIRMSIYNTGGHGIAGTVYNSQSLYDWLLVKRKNNVATPAPTEPTNPSTPNLPTQPAPASPVEKEVYHSLTLKSGKKLLVYSDDSVEVVNG